MEFGDSIGLFKIMSPTDLVQSYHGLILAAGTSSRMGFPKALLSIGDSFFLHKVYCTFLAAGVRPVLIVTNQGLLECMGEERMKLFEGVQFIANHHVEAGQIHSLQLGLETAKAQGAKGVLVGLVDALWVKRETISALLETARANPDCIVAPTFEGRHGHPFFIPVCVFKRFLAATGTAQEVMHSLAEKTVYAEVSDAGVLKDADTPEDLSK